MPRNTKSGAPQAKRYWPEEKARAVRQLRKELGTSDGTIEQVADQTRVGNESLKVWVRRAGIDDDSGPGLTSEQAARSEQFDQATRELQCANETSAMGSAHHHHV